MASKGPECSISYESYNDKDKCPRFLGCGHTFCSRCLERLLPGNTIDCPKCRNPGTVPSGVEATVKEFCIIGHGEQNGTQTTRFAKYQGKEAFASRE